MKENTTRVANKLLKFLINSFTQHQKIIDYTILYLYKIYNLIIKDSIILSNSTIYINNIIFTNNLVIRYNIKRFLFKLFNKSIN